MGRPLPRQPEIPQSGIALKQTIHWLERKFLSVAYAVHKGIVRLPLYFKFRVWNQKRRQARDYAQWQERRGTQGTPHIVKQQIIRAYADKFGIASLVETGTYFGDMVEAMRPVFKKIYSIELSPHLYRTARRRFARAKTVTLVHGDSATELGKIVKDLDGTALFWLDGHYSAGVTAKGEQETPILDELEQILSSRQGDVILVDDARCFGDMPSYPALDDLRRYVLAKNPELSFDVEDDIIRIAPRRAMI